MVIDDNLVKQYEGLVHYVIQKKIGVNNSNKEYDDLYQVGLENLVKAAQRYDNNKSEFKTYAYKYIYGGVLKYFRDYSNNTYGIRVPRGVQDIYKKYVKLENTGHSEEEILSKMSDEEIIELQKVISLNEKTLSLDLENRNEDSINTVSLHESIGNEEEFDIIKKIELQEKLKILDYTLKEKERAVLIHNLNGLTQKEIAKIEGVSQANVSCVLSRITNNIIKNINKKYERTNILNKIENESIDNSIYNYFKDRDFDYAI